MLLSLCTSFWLPLLVLCQYRSHFFLTEKKWYNNVVLTYGSGKVEYINLAGIYPSQKAMMFCARQCSVHRFCEAFILVNKATSTYPNFMWQCGFFDSNTCLNPDRYLMSAGGSNLWDRVQAIPNDARSCISRRPGMDSTNFVDYCPSMRPTCGGENCTNCPTNCWECANLYNRSQDQFHDCHLWPNGYKEWIPPPALVTRCYGQAQYVMSREVNTATGQDDPYWTLGKPTAQSYNWTAVQSSWNPSYQRVSFQFKCGSTATQFYEARYNNFVLYNNGTLSMSFVDGNAGDGFQFGGNTNGSLAHPFVWLADGSPCGTFWNLAGNSSCPGGEALRFWGRVNVSENDFGIRWPGVSNICNITSFAIIFDG